MINLQFLGPIQAEGKTPGDLQREIQGLYVPKLYTRLTVTLKTENRFFYVDGEVRSSGRLIYAEEITVMRAIAAAGGFNDFAARTRVELVRATGEKLVIDARKTKNNPKLDPIVLPGDQIFVPRRSPFGK
jgi:polysaccharide export outer membrane protein